MNGITKKILIFIVSIFLVLYYVFDITPISYQYRLSSHKNLGKEVVFAQPLNYTVRSTPSIVPIVNKIQNELGSLYPAGKYDEKINQYIPYDTVFKITDIYAYADIINKKEFYYVLIDKENKKYTISEYFYNDITKPIYPNAKTPIKIIDKLFFNKKSIEIKFYAVTGNNPRLVSSYFNDCKIKDFSVKKWQREAIAKVNFTQLVCLYNYFWDDFNSDIYPVSFEITMEVINTLSLVPPFQGVTHTSIIDKNNLKSIARW